MSTPHPQSQPEMSTASPAQGSVPNSPPSDVPLPDAAQTVLNFMGQANTAREQLSSSAREQISHAREHLSDPPTSATVLGAAGSVLSRLASSSVHHYQHHHSQAANTSGSQPLPEVPRDLSAEASAPPADAPTPTPAPVRPAEPTAPLSTSTPSHGATVGRAITPPTRGSRATRLSYPAVPEVAHSRPIPVPYGTAYRRSVGPFVDSETAWNATDERDPFREPTVKERIGDTINSAKLELAKATYNAWKTNLLLNIALSLQVLIGALTTALGAALGGKKTSVAISILGGASTLVASYLARTKGSNEPQLSTQRAQALDHFLREIEGFKLDYGHKSGSEWDDKVHGFRLGLEKILGNKPGSVKIDPDGSFNPNQEKGVGGVDPSPGFNQGSNGNSYGKSYSTNATKLEV